MNFDDKFILFLELEDNKEMKNAGRQNSEFYFWRAFVTRANNEFAFLFLALPVSSYTRPFSK